MRPPFNRLNPVQQSTLLGVCSGKSNRAIAQELNTTEQYIKNQVNVLLTLSCQRSRMTLALYCFRNSVVPCPCPNRKA